MSYYYLTHTRSCAAANSTAAAGSSACGGFVVGSDDAWVSAHASDVVGMSIVGIGCYCLFVLLAIMCANDWFIALVTALVKRVAVAASFVLRPLSECRGYEYLGTEGIVLIVFALRLGNLAREMIRARRILLRGPGTLQVFVTTIEGRTITISCKLSATIASMKRSIADKVGMPIEWQRLVFGGKELQDHLTFRDYNIHRDSTLTLVMSLKGKQNVGRHH